MYLKRKHKVRKKKKMPFKVEKGIKDRISIDERSKIVDRRIELGHWEGDSIVSRKSKVGLNTLVERVSGLVKISKIINGTGQVVNNRLKFVPKHLRKTLTVDNGSENAGHKDISKSLDIKVYFAHPYHSWKRGTNENTNGLIRYYFPKGIDLATITNKQI